MRPRIAITTWRRELPTFVGPRTRLYTLADEQRLEWMQAGDHARIIDAMDDYHPHNPEGGFGHVLAMLGAVGGRECTATGELYSDYENATGTGQVHVWFERPEGGWTA